MIGMDRHCRVVGASLAGEQDMDQAVRASLSVLSERLSRLKQRSSLFAGVQFSPYVRRLRQRSEPVVVG